MTAAHPCLFCFAERAGNIKRSSEHFISRPVAQAFGIDRDDGEVYRFAADNVADARVVRLNGLKRKCVCRDCNSGWMNQLEHRMVDVAVWFAAGDRELSEDLQLDLRKWVLTRHLLLTEMDGNASKFGDTDALSEDYVIPLSTLGRALFEHDVEAILEVPVALTRSTGGFAFAWAFGHPTVQPKDRPQLGRFAATSVLTLGEFQVWTATPIIFDYEIYAPDGLTLCQPGLRAEDLGWRAGLPQSQDLTVKFLDVENTSKMLDEMTRRTEAEIEALAQGAPLDPTS